MIYRVFSPTNEYLLTGTPGLDLGAAFGEFKGRLSGDPATRRSQLLEVLEFNAPGEEPTDDLLAQAFVACVGGSLDLRRRGMTEVNLAA